MKILFITSLLGKQYGGAEVSTHLLFKKLFDCGFEIKALTTRKVKENNNLLSISFPIEIPKKLLTIGNTCVDYFLERKIKKILERLQPDVIHIQDTYILPAAVAANNSLKIPIVATIRNSVLDETWELMFPKPISTLLKRRNKKIIKALHKIDIIISVSDYIKNELTKRGLDNERIITIYNLPPKFKDDIKIPQKTSTVNLFALGFLAKFKGFSVLVKSIELVVKNDLNVHLKIAGEGPEKKGLKKMVRNFGLESHIEFIGKIPFDGLSQQYSECDIVIFPSIYAEPFGRVALEAMYHGKPVIASKVGGIPEIVENSETGILVKPDDVYELAQAIINLVINPSLRKKMGKKGRIAIENLFNEENIVNQTLAVYETVIKNHHPSKSRILGDESNE